MDSTFKMKWVIVNKTLFKSLNPHALIVAHMKIANTFNQLFKYARIVGRRNQNKPVLKLSHSIAHVC